MTHNTQDVKHCHASSKAIAPRIITALICLLIISPSGTWGRVNRKAAVPMTRDWQMGSRPVGVAYPPEEIAVRNSGCPGSQSFDITLDAGPWLKLSGPSELHAVRPGDQQTTSVVVDLTSTEPGSYSGVINVRCVTCPGSCRQDVQRIRVAVVAIEAGPQAMAKPPDGGSGPDDDCDTCCMNNFDTGCPGCNCGSEPTCGGSSLFNAADAPGRLRALAYFRDHVLVNTPRGQRLRRLYYRHRARIGYLLRHDANLRNETARVLTDLLPLMERISVGNAEQVVVSETLVRHTELVLSALLASDRQNGGGLFASELQAELADINGSEFVGTPVSVAWKQFSGDAPIRRSTRDVRSGQSSSE